MSDSRKAASIPALTFEARKRVTRPAEFREVRTRGRRLSDYFFSVAVLDNARPHPRLGLAIATRIVGTAVVRNKIKRLVRESFRLNQQTLPGIDVVISVRDAARRADARELRTSLAKFWKTLAERS